MLGRPWIDLPGNVAHAWECPASPTRYEWHPGVVTPECWCGFWLRLWAWGVYVGIPTHVFIPRCNWGGEAIPVHWTVEEIVANWDDIRDVPTVTAYTEIALQVHVEDEGMRQYVGIAYDPFVLDRLCVWVDQNLAD